MLFGVLEFLKKNILIRYWQSYGGISAFVCSPYVWLSLALTFVLQKHWIASEWWQTVLSLMPNLLGFSLGGYAMWVTIGDDEFRTEIINKPFENSTSTAYMEVSATFVHYIVMQASSIIFALIAQSNNYIITKESNLYFLIDYLGQKWFYGFCFIGTLIGYFTFIYAICLTISAALALFYVSNWYSKFYDNKRIVDTQLAKRSPVVERDVEKLKKLYKNLNVHSPDTVNDFFDFIKQSSWYTPNYSQIQGEIFDEDVKRELLLMTYRASWYDIKALVSYFSDSNEIKEKKILELVDSKLIEFVIFRAENLM